MLSPDPEISRVWAVNPPLSNLKIRRGEVREYTHAQLRAEMSTVLKRSTLRIPSFGRKKGLHNRQWVTRSLMQCPINLLINVWHFSPVE